MVLNKIELEQNSLILFVCNRCLLALPLLSELLIMQLSLHAARAAHFLHNRHKRFIPTHTFSHTHAFCFFPPPQQPTLLNSLAVALQRGQRRVTLFSMNA